MNFTYLVQAPRRFTFEQPQLKKWVERWCKGKTLNLFAGKTILFCDEFRVDINKEMKADWYGDAYKFVKTTKMKFDTIILDPPYNLRKAREKYQGKYIGLFTKLKNILIKIINENGRVISFGYDTTGMGKIRGFEKIAMCVVNHSGDHNDTLCLVEELKNKDLRNFSSNKRSG